MILAFGEHELDEERFELRRRGTVVLLQPKVLELLFYLARARERVVSKQEILEQIWPDSVVTDGSIARAVSLARQAVGDRSRDPSVIATIARRGYRFQAPARVLPAPIADAGGAPRYVGRAQLVARVSEILADALGGRGRILFLAGEAGIGKTCTAELLAERACRSGAAVATAWRGDAEAPSYSAWTRVLRVLAALLPNALAELPPAQRAMLAHLLPELAPAGKPRSALPGGESVRLRLFEAVQAFLGRCAAARPVALFLDDLHDAGAESLALLDFVGQTLDSLRIAIVVTCREEETAHTPQLARALQRLLRSGSLERWPLSGLQGDEVRDFVRARLGRDADPPLLAALERQTSGNPLLLGESLRSLEARGLLGERRDASAWESLLPRGIQHLLQPKLRELSAGAASALGCAAALGVELERDLLARCVPDESQLAAQLRELESAGLLSSDSSFALRLRFGHNLIREALYSELVPPGAGRRALHARIAAALPADDPSPDSAAERAHHACEAAPLVEPRLASALAQAVAEHAQRLHDFERAADWYARALAALELDRDADPATAAQLCVWLGAAQTRAAGLERARGSYLAAAQHARAARHGPLLAAAALGFAHRPNAIGHAELDVIELLEEATRALPDDAAALRIRTQSRLAAELRYTDLERAEALVEEAVAAARQLGDPAVLAHALDDSTYVHWSPADPHGWVARNEEVARLAHAAGDLELELAGQIACATGRLELGDMPAVDREIRACERTSEAAKTSYARWLCSAMHAMRSLVDGDLEASERRVGESLRLGEQVESVDVLFQLQSQIVYLRVQQGRAAEIEPAARAQVQRFPEAPAWRAAFARTLVGAGRITEAGLELARLARRRFTDVPRDRGWMPALALAAEVAFATSDAQAADLLAELLAPFVQLSVVAGRGLLYYGSVAYHLGLLDLTRTRWDAAIAHLERALAAEVSAGARIWEARARIAHARALLGRGLPRDRPRAVSLVTAAAELSRSAGWIEVAAETRAVEAALWTQRRRAGPAGQS